MALIQTVIECLLVEENSTLLVCAAKIFFEAAGHGSRANRRLTKFHMCSIVTYAANKPAKEEFACVVMNRNLEQSSQHVGMHYHAERLLHGILEGRERLRTVVFLGRTCCY